MGPVNALNFLSGNKNLFLGMVIMNAHFAVNMRLNTSRTASVTYWYALYEMTYLYIRRAIGHTSLSINLVACLISDLIYDAKL